MIVLRSVLFTAWLYGSMAVVGLGGLPLLLGPRQWALAVIRVWASSVLWGLKVFAGGRVEFRGLEHRPTGAALVAAKHQGMLDVIVPFLLLPDPCFVLKRELMWLPVFGWYAWKTDMIPIDRSAGATALKSMVARGKARLAQGRQIVIFPEGTRTEPGVDPEYKPGVAGLYRDFDVPCALVATNSGVVWPAHGFVRRPGVAVFEFLPALPAGLKRHEFMREVQGRIETASKALL